MEKHIEKTIGQFGYSYNVNETFRNAMESISKAVSKPDSEFDDEKILEMILYCTSSKLTEIRQKRYMAKVDMQGLVGPDSKPGKCGVLPLLKNAE